MVAMLLSLAGIPVPTTPEGLVELALKAQADGKVAVGNFAPPRVTGEIRVLHSVHAADIGRPINPMQCRGQLDGAIAMGYGWALTENMVHDQGHMVNAQLRNYRIPAYADTPHTDIFFADTVDSIGPLGAKSQGECGINPVAPAVANALADACGLRLRDLPLSAERVKAGLAAIK